MIARYPLQIQAYNYIKDLILSDKLDHNTLYSETKLAAQYGISRTPMREALQCLSQDGYINIIPSKGFMIRQLNEEDMIESIQVRCAIEGFCTHIAALEADTKKGCKLMSTMKELLDKQEQSVNIQDGHEAFMEYDHEFHLALVEFVGNQEFSHIFQRLMYLIHLTTVSSLSVPGRIEETLKEHQEFYEYLKAGDGDAAYCLLIKHLNMPLKIHLAKSR